MIQSQSANALQNTSQDKMVHVRLILTPACWKLEIIARNAQVNTEIKMESVWDINVWTGIMKTIYVENVTQISPSGTGFVFQTDAPNLRICQDLFEGNAHNAEKVMFLMIFIVSQSGVTVRLMIGSMDFVPHAINLGIFWLLTGESAWLLIVSIKIYPVLLVWKVSIKLAIFVSPIIVWIMNKLPVPNAFPIINWLAPNIARQSTAKNSSQQSNVKNANLTLFIKMALAPVASSIIVIMD